MKVLYALYSDPETAQRAVDALQAASSELKFDPEKIVIVSGEPHEGYDFADSHITSHPYRWAVFGAMLGGTCGYLLTTLTQKAYPIVTGGMSITPGWTNGIIVYEMTMLGAILTTLFTLLRGARLPNFKEVIKDPEIWLGKILVGVADPPESCWPELERYLLQAGAIEVKQSSGASG
ncbi:MAG: quinol:electron acceptor oxidoreductase subunit ActD [Candidatus Sulfotelmatobacter sp.]